MTLIAFDKHTRVEWRVVDGFVRPHLDGDPVAWAPQPGSQVAFMQCPVYEVLLHGNRGGGKTEVLLADFAQHVGRDYGPQWKGVLFRKSYKELSDVVDKSKLMFANVWPEAKFNHSEMRWTWPSGEQLILAYMERTSDYDKHHGKAYPWIGWEELTLWADSEAYMRMMSCCRSPHPKVPRKIRATTNPYGPGMNWVKARFRLPAPSGRMFGEIIRDPDEGDRIAIRSDLRENLTLMHAEGEGYIQKLKMAARNPAELAAWLHGDWNITSGGMFDDIWIDVQHAAVLPPFEIPRSWRIDRAFDWGSSKPFSVGWYAESDGTPIIFPDGRRMHTVRGDLVRFREWYGWNGQPNKGLRYLARDISEGIIQREIDWGLLGRVRTGIADAAIFTEQNGNCIARDMEATVRINGKAYRGVYFDPADSEKAKRDRKQGWEQIRKRLAATIPNKPGEPREEPGLFVTTDCPQFLRTIPVLPRDDRDMDDVDSDSEDHIADEVRYRVRKEHRVVKSGKTFGAW